MRSPLSFFVAGCPVAQPRLRHRVMNGKGGKAFAMGYNPPDADDWKLIVRKCARDAWDQAEPLNGTSQPTQWTGPLKVDLIFLFPRPLDHFKKSGLLKDNAPAWKTGRPDRDNLDKAVLDAITNLGLWHDDCQVVTGRIEKRYVTGCQRPGCEITISEAETPGRLI